MNRFAPTAVKYIACGLAKTWRVRILGVNHVRELTDSGTPFIYALWHSQILPLLWYHRGSGAALVVSEHRDGGLLAEAAHSWGFHLIRGSSTRGGVAAVRGAVRALRTGRRVAITPDGPRGPLGRIKPGVLKVAKMSGCPILPVVARVCGAWRLDSWDRFVVPMPFALVEIQYMAPIRVTDPASLGTTSNELMAALNDREAKC